MAFILLQYDSPGKKSNYVPLCFSFALQRARVCIDV